MNEPSPKDNEPSRGHFEYLGQYDVKPLREELAAHPELWNQHSQRKTATGSPHGQMDDIWVRFRAIEELTSPEKFAEPHVSVFYPAWRLLPSLHKIVVNLYVGLCAVGLGGILITRIPPGGKILPHDDRGSWHPEFYNCKVYIPIEANDQCINYCMDESVVMKPGEVWRFNNLLTHSVENNGDTDRITAIVCMRTLEPVPINTAKAEVYH